MAHFALLDENNTVVMVLAGRDADEGKEIELSDRTGQTYKQTSYNTIGGVHYDPISREPSADQSKAFRKNYAGIGYTYDAGRDAFIPPKPFASWTLNEDTCLWNAPTPMPTDGQIYAWNEDTTSWELINE